MPAVWVPEAKDGPAERAAVGRAVVVLRGVDPNLTARALVGLCEQQREVPRDNKMVDDPDELAPDDTGEALLFDVAQEDAETESAVGSDLHHDERGRACELLGDLEQIAEHGIGGRHGVSDPRKGLWAEGVPWGHARREWVRPD